MADCSICGDPEPEIWGNIGILPAAFCANCWFSLVEFIRETDGCVHGVACEQCALDEAE
jgi:hypothetical protein